MLTAELTRRTPLTPGTGPIRRTPLQRGAGLARTSAPNSARKPKHRPPGEAAAENSARDLVYARSEGTCELQILGHCQGRATNWAHRLPAGQGGRWAASNGLHLCGLGNASGCHGYSETHRTVSYRFGWLLKRGQNPLLVPVVLPDGRVHLGDDGEIHPCRKDCERCAALLQPDHAA